MRTLTLALSLLSLIGAPRAHAAQRDRKLQVQLLGAEVDGSAFPADAYSVHRLKERKPENPLPPVGVRDEIFEEAHLSALIETMDDLDRDTLWRKVAAMPESQTPKQYRELKSRIENYETLGRRRR